MCKEAMIRMVKVGSDEFATLDDYAQDLDLDNDVPDDDFWCDEDAVTFNSVPENTTHAELWVDQLADEVEIQRLLSMDVHRSLRNATMKFQER
eukprot:s97_g17.t1